jgi:hypothetical protein
MALGAGIMIALIVSVAAALYYRHIRQDILRTLGQGAPK